MSSVSHHLERSLDPAMLDLLRRASKASAGLGVELFLVGGGVRDILSGSPLSDLDLMYVGGTGEFPAALAERLDGDVERRSRFDTAKIRAGDLRIDLAAARSETYPHPGSLPVVVPGSLDEDLARRDFSVNAMAVSLAQATWGELLDPFDGRRDVESGLIRALHPGSFIDDPTRTLRAVRYSQRAGFSLDPETARLMRRDLGYMGVISGDRVRHEIERIFWEPRAGAMIEAAQQLGVLEAVHPALRIGPPLMTKLQSVIVEPTLESALRLLAMTVFDVPVTELPSLIERLNMDSSWSRVVTDVGRVKDSLPQLGEERTRRSQVYGLLHRLDPAAVDGCALATDDSAAQQSLRLYLSELRHVEPLLGGNDLMAVGVPEGPLVGKLLGKLLTARLEGLVATREDEETLVVRTMESEDR